MDRGSEMRVGSETLLIVLIWSMVFMSLLLYTRVSCLAMS